MSSDNLFGETDNKDLAPDLFKKKSGMGSVQIPPQLAFAKDWVLAKKEQIRPWQEFGNFNRASKPQSVGIVTRRVTHNVAYYYGNYGFISALLIIYCIISSPLLLLAICVSGTAVYLIKTQKDGKTITVAGHTLTPHDQAVVAGCVSLPLLFFASAGTVIFWIIGLTASVVGVHASAMSLPNEGSDFEMDAVV